MLSKSIPKNNSIVVTKKKMNNIYCKSYVPFELNCCYSLASAIILTCFKSKTKQCTESVSI